MDPVSKINGYFSNEKRNFYSPTRTNKQTNISGFIASLPLHRTTAQAVQKTSLPIPLCLLRPTTPEGLSPWTCSTDRWVGAIAALAHGQTLEPIIQSVLTLLPFHLHGRQTHSSQEISVVLIQLPPPAGASRGADPNCSSLAVAGLLPAVFSSD